MLGAINAPVSVKVLVPHGIRPCTRHILPKRAIDEGARNRARSNVTGNIRKAPCRGAVPQVFDCGVVVKRQTVNQSLSSEFADVRQAHVCVIPTKVVVLPTVSDLDEPTDVIRERTRQEQTCLLGKLHASILGAGNGLWQLRVRQFYERRERQKIRDIDSRSTTPSLF